MKRKPEPELMDAVDQAAAYSAADFSQANELFVSLARRRLGEILGGGRVVDLGCGPADIPIQLARAHPHLRIDAVDGSKAMLAEARRAIDGRGVALQVRPVACHLPALPFAVRYDAVLSNSLLHHLRDAATFWSSVAACGKPGAEVLVMDLMRPASPEQAERLLDAYAGDAPAVLREDFLHSLHAAYTVDEVREQLAAAGLGGFEVRTVSDRHLAAWGALP